LKAPFAHCFVFIDLFFGAIPTPIMKVSRRLKGRAVGIDAIAKQERSEKWVGSS
jgi:hypothetical protein